MKITFPATMETHRVTGEIARTTPLGAGGVRKQPATPYNRPELMSKAVKSKPELLIL
jgi:hypothetical protein